MILRAGRVAEIEEAFRHVPIVSILGPRQSGKTTLARTIARGRAAATFDLEHPSDVARLQTPMTALESLRGLVVIDEVQRMPSLFEVLRVLADRPRRPARFLILGSVDPRLVRGVSESLAGRVRHVDVAGFDVLEAGAKHARKLWVRGGFPRAFLAKTEAASFAWRQDYIRDFLHSDLSQLGITIPAATLGRFWNMLAHLHGNLWSAADLARALGASENTARHYLDLLSGAWAIRQLQPWFENIGKRQVRSPKVYVRDTGLLHTLLGVSSHHDLMGHPKVGASWEGFVIDQVASILRRHELYFWATHQGTELDLLVVRGGKRYGFEVKLSDGPTITKSMHIALGDLGLDRLSIVVPGTRSYPLGERVDVISIGDLANHLRALA